MGWSACGSVREVGALLLYLNVGSYLGRWSVLLAEAGGVRAFLASWQRRNITWSALHFRHLGGLAGGSRPTSRICSGLTGALANAGGSLWLDLELVYERRGALLLLELVRRLLACALQHLLEVLDLSLQLLHFLLDAELLLRAERHRWAGIARLRGLSPSLKNLLQHQQLALSVLLMHLDLLCEHNQLLHG